MKDIAGALAKAGVGFVHWIANLGPYSWNEIAFVLILMISAVAGLIAACSIISRRNRAIEFIDQSEVVTSPLRNRVAPQFAPEPKAAQAQKEDAQPIEVKVTAPAPKPAQPITLVAPVPAATTPIAMTPIRAQLVLVPFGAGSGNVREIAHANAITQRLKTVLGALAPHIEVARDDKALGKDTGLGRYTLTGAVRHMGDRIRVQIEMADTKTGANLFRFRYQGLPSEQDVMLAEITSRVLKATSRPASERKNDAA